MRSGIAVIDLNLDAALGSKLWNDDLVRNLLEDGRVSLSPEAVIESMQVGGGNNILQMRRLQAGNQSPQTSHLVSKHVRRWSRK